MRFKNMCSKNCRPNKHLIVGLTVSTAIAVVETVRPKIGRAHV